MIALAPTPRRLRLGQQPDGQALATAAAQANLLKAHGALLEINLGVPRAVASGILARGGQVPQPMTFVAMIDTGASMMSMSNDVAVELGLTPVDRVSMTGAGGPIPGGVPVYAASLGFGDPSIPGLDAIRVAGIPLSSSSNFHVLIGRDVLEYLVLTYDGPRGVFSLAPGGNAPPPSAAPYVQPAQPAQIAQSSGGLDIGEFPTTLVVAGVGIGLLNILGVI